MTGYDRSRRSFYFQFITTPTADTPGTALYLHFDNKRYLFGRIAEGTQRACIQRGVGLKNIRDLFVTGPANWNTTGGLIGTILTMSDIPRSAAAGDTSEKVPSLTIHGAPGLLHTLACARRFVFRTGMPLAVLENFPNEQKTRAEPTWSDENIEVWALPVKATPKRRPSVSERSESESDDDSIHEADPQLRSSAAADAYGECGRTSQVSSLREENQQARRSIVDDMFNSEWRRDRLVETPFGDVQFPAVVFTRDPKTKELLPFRCESASSCPHIQPSTTVLVRNPWPASLIGNLPSAEDLPRDIALSYIVRGRPQRGKFDPKAAIKLGVTPGPDFSVLTNGQPVQLADGSVITPDMVLGPQKPSQGIAIVDLPSRKYLEDFVAQPEWRDKQLMHGVKAMVWITRTHPLRSPLILEFMKSIPTMEHIIASPRVGPSYLAMESSAISAFRLSRIWDEVFPIPDHDRAGIEPKASGIQGESSSELIFAKRGLRIQLEPKFELKTAEIPPYLNLETEVNEIPARVSELAAFARSEISEAMESVDDLEPQIITLGTGSAVPSKYRNVSATLLRIPGQGSYLFDCGENALGQLYRAFGKKIAKDVLLDLKMIWISHLHADHHLGTTAILTKVDSLRKNSPKVDTRELPPLFVVGEEKMVGFLEDYSSLRKFEGVQPVVATLAGMSIKGSPFTFESTAVPIKKLESCSVSHCYGAQAVSVTFANGFKFSYSGDCRPSENFAKIGARSDVLVHEATFEDGMEGDAMAKKHCTTGEALAVGAMMGAKNVILTHFSQRYQKLPVMGDVKLPKTVRFEEGDESATEPAGPVDEALEDDVPKQPPPYSNAADTSFLDALIMQTLKPEELPPLDMNVCVAFDYMKIKVSQIKQMQKLTPALQALFEVESKGPVADDMSEAQKNAQINRGKAKADKKTEQVNAQAGNTVDGAEKPKTEKQLRHEAKRVRHEHTNAKNAAKRSKPEGADEENSSQVSPSSEKRRKSSETVVPRELVVQQAQGKEMQMKDAAG